TAPAGTVVEALRDLDRALVEQAADVAEAEAAAEAARAEAEEAAAALEAAEERVAELRGGPPVAAPVDPPAGDVVGVLDLGGPTTVAVDEDAEVTTPAEAEAERDDAAEAAGAEAEEAAAALEAAGERVAELRGGPPVAAPVDPPAGDVVGVLDLGGPTTVAVDEDAEVTTPAEAEAERDDAAEAAARAAEAAEEAAAEAEEARAVLEAIEARESSFVEEVEARVRSAAEPDPAEGPAKGEAAAGGAAPDGGADEVADIATALDEITRSRPERLPAAAGEGDRARQAPAEPAPAPPTPPPPLVLPDPRGSASGAVVPAWCPNGQPVIVDASIGGNVQALLNDAHAQGVDICAKSAFRPYAEQVELRRQNCGDSDHAIF